MSRPPVYGLGKAEEIVGRAVENMSTRPIIATKCGRMWDDARRITAHIKKDSVKRECEASLRRLGVEIIDLYQMHWPEPDEDVEEGWGAITDLKAEGKIRWGGVSNFSSAQLERAQAHAPVASLQPPYSMLRREVESGPLPWCREHGVGVVAYSPMQKGLLTGKVTPQRVAAFAENDHRRRDPMFRGEGLARANQVAAVLGDIGAAHDATAAAVSIAWVLQHPAVTSAIVGARQPHQLDDIVVAADLNPSADEMARIEAALG